VAVPALVTSKTWLQRRTAGSSSRVATLPNTLHHSSRRGAGRRSVSQQAIGNGTTVLYVTGNNYQHCLAISHRAGRKLRKLLPMCVKAVAGDGQKMVLALRPARATGSAPLPWDIRST